MKLLNQKLQELRKTDRLGLMTHVVIGYPSLAETITIVKQMEKSGVDIVELQIPFSDPLADGPTIMKACEVSLKNGTKVSDAFKIMKILSSEVSIPLLFMAYYNTVFRYKNVSSRGGKRRGDPIGLPAGKAGIASSEEHRTRNDSVSGVGAFCRDAKAAGCEGLIVPDVPLDEEENEHFIASCKKFDLANIRVVSPSSTPERLQKNARVASGFVYATARQGITGARKDLDNELTAYLKTVRQYFKIPIAVGFGISKREHIEALKGKADIAIVGSAIIDIINASTSETLGKNTNSFISGLKLLD